MSKEMPISELIKRYGDGEIEVQNLFNDKTAMNSGKDGSTITFATRPDIVTHFMACDLMGDKPTKTALVIWMDTAKAKGIISDFEEESLTPPDDAKDWAFPCSFCGGNHARIDCVAYSKSLKASAGDAKEMSLGYLLAEKLSLMVNGGQKKSGLVRFPGVFIRDPNRKGELLCLTNQQYDELAEYIAAFALRDSKKDAWIAASKFETKSFDEDEWKLCINNDPTDVFTAKWIGVFWQDKFGNDCAVSHVMPLPPAPARDEKGEMP